MSSPTCTFNVAREPWVTFDIPNISGGIAEKIGIHIKGTYGILLPSIQLYKDVFKMSFIVLFLGGIISVVIYFTVLSTKTQHCYSTNTAHLIAFGVIIPTCLILPYMIATATNIQNTIIRNIFCVPFGMYTFRCIEALFGFSPPEATSSPIKYAIYYTLPVEFMYDNKSGSSVKATMHDLKSKIFVLARTSVILSIGISLLLHYGVGPFRSRNAAGEIMTLKDHLDVMHLGNSFIIAFMLQLGLSFAYGLPAFFVCALGGDKVANVMKNPLLEATSPSDFWGRRWNMVVHGFLKRGVFKPIRKYSSAFVASLGAFIASGLLHEYIVHLVFIYKRNPRMIYSSSCPEGVIDYEPKIGTNMAFFAWNGILIVIEKLLRKHSMFTSIGLVLPRFVVTLLIIMTALPVMHWLSDPYVKGPFFYDLQEGLLLITKLA